MMSLQKRSIKKEGNQEKELPYTNHVSVYQLKTVDKGIAFILFISGFGVLLGLYSVLYPVFSNSLPPTIVLIVTIDLFVLLHITSINQGVRNNTKKVKSKNRQILTSRCCINTFNSGRYYCDCGKAVINDRK